MNGPHDGRTVLLTEISRQTYEEQGLQALGSDCGLFLAVEDVAATTLDVLAKVPAHGADRLCALIGIQTAGESC
ncbi:hypothetical protein BHAOGJBA_1711 [Methylobacterium hispanicum]|uniref:Uncharacterized protein n=1 Tax=Methylobacterium hispanicum TaxID=270350 RepID=A0AAV4ZJ42_9HYPH|nr:MULTISPECIES: hypothetical protein [Methylobacterium]GJD88198.1 hypothetical protein BHAOGJBA_1711 [Methylobacterium hispanicum]